MSLTVRVARADDAEVMEQCSLRTFPLETPSIDYFVYILSSWPGLSCLAANGKDEVVGACLVRLKDEIEDATHAHVTTIFVLPGYQGQGVGRRFSLQSAKTQFNVSEVTLHVRKSNEHAIGLYTSLKFYTITMKPEYYDDGEDAFAMTLLLGNDVNG